MLKTSNKYSLYDSADILLLQIQHENHITHHIDDTKTHDESLMIRNTDYPRFPHLLGKKRKRIKIKPETN